MLNSTYGAGFRSGMAEPTLFTTDTGLKYITRAVCPFPKNRFISRWLWESGYHNGMIKRLTAPQRTIRNFRAYVETRNPIYLKQLNEETDRMFSINNIWAKYRNVK